MHLCSFMHLYVCTRMFAYETICVEDRGKYEVTSLKVVCVSVCLCIHSGVRE